MITLLHTKDYNIFLCSYYHFERTDIRISACELYWAHCHNTMVVIVECLPKEQLVQSAETLGDNFPCLHSVQCSLCTTAVSALSSHCLLHTTHYTLRTAHCPIHTAHYTLRTAHYTLRTAHCTLHTAHPIFPVLDVTGDG